MKRILFLIFFLSTQVPAQDVTFYKHIAPILVDNCIKCHREGEVTPFPLTTYEEVSSKAKLVAEVTKSRYMPPWIADENYLHYPNERLLTKKQINTIQSWVSGGKKKGNPADMPPIPNYLRNSMISRLPDMII
ncbi:MAG: redoxin, partial [Bacteroidetes bacterium]|nr:redoxin [Bacteroidota bacterium]